MQPAFPITTYWISGERWGRYCTGMQYAGVGHEGPGGTPSQPELVGNPVSLRPPNWPKGGAMDLLGIPGLNLAQESGREGLEPSRRGAFLCPRLHWRVGKKSEF